MRACKDKLRNKAAFVGQFLQCGARGGYKIASMLKALVFAAAMAFAASAFLPAPAEAGTDKAAQPAHAASPAMGPAGGAAQGRASPSSPPPSLDADAYDELVRNFLLEQASPYTGTPQIHVEGLAADRFAACEHAEAFLPQGSSLRSRLTVGLRCIVPQSWVGYVQANVSIEGPYYVAARALKAGTALDSSHIAERSGDLLRLPRGAVLHADQLLGAITTQRIAAGSVIKAGTLRSADSVQRGQMVRLEARGDGFVATSDGKAMQSGEPGSQIQVRTNSGQLVSGTVMNAQTVLILM